MAEPSISDDPSDESRTPPHDEDPRHSLSGNSQIEVLPEDVLLEIFDFYKLASISLAWGWYKLVHVCRRWRYVIFASQHRLDLRLLCTYGTPVRKTLDCWPALPIIIRYRDATNRFRPPSSDDEDNIIAALQYRDRVCEIDLEGSLFVKLSALMQEPFPSLECLVLSSRHNADLVLPNTFLGGSVPRLRNLYLDVIALPALPQLLRSAKDLVHLHLQRIPGRGYISPEALVTSLSAMTKLKVLRMHFTSPTSRPDPRSTPPPPPAGRGVVLPSLTHLAFRGASEYLEGVVARIGSAPSLERTCISFFDQPTFEIPRLAQFLGHAESAMGTGTVVVGRPGEAKLLPRRDGISIALIRTGGRTAPGPAPGDPPAPAPPHATGTATSREWLRLDISCVQPGRQVSSMTQICRQIFPLLSGVQKLDVLTSSFAPAPPIARVSGQEQGQAQDDDDDEADADTDANANATGRRWLGLLHVFGGVQVLRVGYGSVPDVARALQQHVAAEMAAADSGSDPRSADVLPALRELYFDWFASRWDEAVAPFLTARQRSSLHPITYHRPKVLDD